MNLIADVTANDATAWFKYPDISKFKVKLKFLNKEDLIAIRKRASSFQFNNKSRQREEVLDEDKFTKLYIEEAVLDWKGLKIKHLPQLMPSDIAGKDPETEVEFSKEHAISLVRRSTYFDQFITESMSDFENFSRTAEEEEEKN